MLILTNKSGDSNVVLYSTFQHHEHLVTKRHSDALLAHKKPLLYVKIHKIDNHPRVPRFLKIYITAFREFILQYQKQCHPDPADRSLQNTDATDLNHFVRFCQMVTVHKAMRLIEKSHFFPQNVTCLNLNNFIIISYI